MNEDILVAGIGNIFLGDDGFGVQVAQRLSQRRLPEEVRVVDFGIRGMDLTYALLDGYKMTILVDAVPRGGEPGELYLIEPEIDQAPPPDMSAPMMDTHNVNPAKVLQLVKAMGGHPQRLLLVGCEPMPPGHAPEMHMGLSQPVQESVEEAVTLVEHLIADFLDKDSNGGAR